MFAYIPARKGSKRIPHKNIKQLGGRPIICHVVENILASNRFSGVGISTDSDEIIDLFEGHDKVVTLSKRVPELCDDRTGFNQLVIEDIPRFAEHFNSTEVLFTLATAALVRPETFVKASQLLKLNPEALLMSVVPYPVSPELAITLDEQCNLQAKSPESYLIDTKLLKTQYFDAGCFYLFDTKFFPGKMLDFKLKKGVILDSSEGIDVDNQESWDLLEFFYRRKSLLSS